MIITTIIVTAIPTFTIGVFTGRYILQRAILVSLASDYKKMTNNYSYKYGYKDCDNIALFSSRKEAEDTRTSLLEMITDYGNVTIADYKDLIGVATNFTDIKRGWTDLSRVRIIRIRHGYVINLPKAIILD